MAKKRYGHASFLLIVTFMMVLLGCTFYSPGQTVQNFFMKLQAQDLEAAGKLIYAEEKEGRANFLAEEELEDYLVVAFLKVQHEIIEVSQDGDSAEVITRVAAPDLFLVATEAYSRLFPKAMDAAFEGEEFNFERKFSNYLLTRVLQEEVPFVINDVAIELHKDDNSTWKIVPTDSLVRAITGRLTEFDESLIEGL